MLGAYLSCSPPYKKRDQGVTAWSKLSLREVLLPGAGLKLAWSVHIKTRIRIVGRWCEIDSKHTIGYYFPMRTLFIALLIAMLPLRGWVGGAMATEMASSQAQVQSAVSMPSDCVHVEMTQKDKARCGACTTCQVCHIVGLAASVSISTTVSTPSSLPQFAAAQFASADPALGQKPPIC